MTLMLHLPLELEQRLTQEARRQGLPIDAYTLQLLDKHLLPKDHRAEIITLNWVTASPWKWGVQDTKTLWPKNS